MVSTRKSVVAAACVCGLGLGATGALAGGGGEQRVLSVTIINLGASRGDVHSDPSGVRCPDNCSAPFDQGSVVVLTARPDSDSRFVRWSGAGCESGNPCTVTMDQDTAVTATFRCIADANADGTVNVADVLTFLQQFAAGEPGADIHGEDGINVDDFLRFLEHFARGC
jgi:hypothetical protein